MRRPLFGNGIPKNVLNADGVVPVFDTSGLDPKVVYALTIFCWSWKNLPTPILAAEPNLLIGVVSDGQPVVAVAAFSPTFFFGLKSQQPQGQPVLVLDRYLMRGNQQLFVQNDDPGLLATSCWLYGYFEAVGESPISNPFRPLQPGPLVPPFSPSPTLVFPVGPNASEYKTAHKLDANFVDALTLNVLDASKPLAAYGVLPLAFVRLPGGLKMPLPMPPVGAPAGEAIDCTPFDSIPMRAPSAADNLIEIGFDNNGNVASGAALSGFGRFRRY
jgi:hypothetical protein